MFTVRGKLLCLDIGKKKTGIAISDITQSFAKGIDCVPTKILYQTLDEIISKEDIKGLVIGLPLNKDNTKNKASEDIEKRAIKISEKYGLSVNFQDEKLTSWEAREYLKEMGYKFDEITKLEDQTAAQIILQNYLDSNIGEK